MIGSNLAATRDGKIEAITVVINENADINNIEVLKAELQDGLLSIFLSRIIPEEDEAKIIDII